MSSYQLLKKEECLGKMEHELDARTRDLNRTQEELVTSNQLSSDLSQRLQELQRHCATLEEQRFLLGLWGPWERCWCSVAKAHPRVPIAHDNFFILVLDLWLLDLSLHAEASGPLLHHSTDSLSLPCIGTSLF